ncbi:hypothetical protein D3C73_696370 [compost metagenome]
MPRYSNPGACSHDFPRGHVTARRGQPGCRHATGLWSADHHRPGGRVVGGAGVGPERDGDQGCPRRHPRRIGHRLRRRHLAGRQLHRDLGGGHGFCAVVLGDVLAATVHPLRHQRIHPVGRVVPARSKLRKPAGHAHLARPGGRCVAADADDRRPALFAGQREALRSGRLHPDGHLRSRAGHAAGGALD